MEGLGPPERSEFRVINLKELQIRHKVGVPASSRHHGGGFSLVCYYFWELQIRFSVRPIGAPKNAAIVDHISGCFDAG